MVVRIRFRRGPRVERRKGKNSKVAWMAAGLLTLGSVSCLTLGVWRMGVDFGWAAEFVFPAESVLSHWQVWLASALLIQFTAWKLNRYGSPGPLPAAEVPQPEPVPEKKMAAGA